MCMIRLSPLFNRRAFRSGTKNEPRCSVQNERGGTLCLHLLVGCWDSLRFSKLEIRANIPNIGGAKSLALRHALVGPLRDPINRSTLRTAKVREILFGGRGPHDRPLRPLSSASRRHSVHCSASVLPTGWVGDRSRPLLDRVHGRGLGHPLAVRLLALGQPGLEASIASAVLRIAMSADVPTCRRAGRSLCWALRFRCNFRQAAQSLHPQQMLTLT
ncbi:MAG: hypothetical protein JWO36_1536 [Myxococcales bacterium]|nr:hypothetical protein [Myxococcales bacterium]